MTAKYPEENRESLGAKKRRGSPAGEERRNFGSPLGMKFIALLMRLCPRSIVYLVSIFPVLWYYLKHAEVRRSSRVYQQMLGLEMNCIGRFAFGFRQARAYSFVILDNMYLGMFGKESFALKQQGIEVFREALAKERGLIMLSAHVGNWHLAVNFLNEGNRRVHLVMDDVRIEEVRRKMDSAKAANGNLTVHDAKQEGLIFELKTALQSGEIVILAGDRTIGRRRVRTDFFRGKAWFPTAAYALAATTETPICLALALRTGMQRYDCFGLSITAIGQEKSALCVQEPAALASKFASQLETHLRKFPEQWFNFYDFWAD
jgi:predicted LPLAT superfamily acyltransferase